MHTGSLAAGAPNGKISLNSSGETHSENFDSLGAPGTPLPFGWSASVSGNTSSVITLPFPVTDVVVSKVYNAGKIGDDDRDLATGNVDSGASYRIQLWGELTESEAVGAVMVDARVEAWVGDDPGGADYLISLKFDPEKDGPTTRPSRSTAGTRSPPLCRSRQEPWTATPARTASILPAG